MSTSSIVVVCSSSARASEIVRVGRLSRSRNSAPLAKLLMPNRCTKMMRGPTWAMASRTDWSKPRMSAVMPTIDVMPMTTPRTVRPERSLFVRTVSNAIVTTSQSSPNRMAINSQLSRLNSHR